MIDMQESLLKNIFNASEIINSCEKLLKIANILDIPVIFSEQYPKGLGKTAPKINKALDKVPRALQFSKMQFSAAVPKLTEELFNTGKTNVIIFGLETHVCILQTARDLLLTSYNPFIVADCVSSRHEFNHKFGLQALHDMAIPIYTIEMLVFDLLKSANHPKFKEIQKLIL